MDGKKMSDRLTVKQITDKISRLLFQQPPFQVNLKTSITWFKCVWLAFDYYTMHYAGRLISRSRMGIPVIGELDLAVSSCTVRTLALSICNRWARPMSFQQGSLLFAESCVKAAGWMHLSTLIPLTWHDPCLKFTKTYYLQCRVESLSTLGH